MEKMMNPEMDVVRFKSNDVIVASPANGIVLAGFNDGKRRNATITIGDDTNNVKDYVTLLGMFHDNYTPTYFKYGNNEPVADISLLKYEESNRLENGTYVHDDKNTKMNLWVWDHQ